MKPYGKKGKQNDCCPGHDGVEWTGRSWSRASARTKSENKKILHRKARRTK